MKNIVRNISRNAIKINGITIQPEEEKEVELTGEIRDFFGRKIIVKKGNPSKGKGDK
jgi:hypothetical protein